MPPAKPKPSDIASEAKRIYIPHIAQYMPDESPTSVQIPDSSYYPVESSKRSQHRLRVAIIDGDPVDVALDWSTYTQQNNALTQPPKIPVVNMANEKRPGGDWESGLLAPEECFCRRSNLIHALLSTKYIFNASESSQYPLPQRGGIYSPHVVIFRDGPDHYQAWNQTDWKSLPVISVAPVRRPKLDESGKRYSFSQERELMLEKMRTVLRITAMYEHASVVLGAFGVGHIFRNPPREVARMWKQLLFHEEEFSGVFANVVFAIQTNQPGNGRAGSTEYEVFQEEFDPSKIFESKYVTK
ncbi:hypothetical protein NA57DRAFT_58438 [Rhizodiscina lignyota]|uniref:Microbial-type PARG catalytic domain-containing protein n=1 Tax=Rhizodiscina lignyota TaxID=1504668 RepID=A0A9P4ICL3_9PEZI|nr:hypothetical protein NA57DRAFT_58438 [Rhizodiscina lignyota]